MKIAAWNIYHGGKNHSAIADALISHDADVIVLSEHRAAKSRPLIERLQSSGWEHVLASPTEGPRNGVAIVSRERLTPRAAPFGEVPFAWWGVEAIVHGVTIIGVYAPLKNSWGSSPEIQSKFWESLHSVVAKRASEPIVMVGDFNTCAPCDGPNPQPCWEAFEQLSVLGWVDGWRHRNFQLDDHSWVNRSVTPVTRYRIDHAFVSPVLADAVSACRYSHAEREAGLSDHSMLLMQLHTTSA